GQDDGREREADAKVLEFERGVAVAVADADGDLAAGEEAGADARQGGEIGLGEGAHEALVFQRIDGDAQIDAEASRQDAGHEGREGTGVGVAVEIDIGAADAAAPGNAELTAGVAAGFEDADFEIDLLAAVERHGVDDGRAAVLADDVE